MILQQVISDLHICAATAQRFYLSGLDNAWDWGQEEAICLDLVGTVKTVSCRVISGTSKANFPVFLCRRNFDAASSQLPSHHIAPSVHVYLIKHCPTNLNTKCWRFGVQGTIAKPKVY